MIETTRRVFYEQIVRFGYEKCISKEDKKFFSGTDEIMIECIYIGSTGHFKLTAISK